MIKQRENFGSRFGIERVDIKKGMVKVKHTGAEVPADMKQYLKALGRNLKYVK